MKLYMVPAAPNPTKVMLYVSERAQAGSPLPIETVLVNTLKGEQRAPEHLARNPFGSVPVLELEDGSYLVESLAIIMYLEERFPDGALMPQEAQARAQHGNWKELWNFASRCRCLATCMRRIHP